MKHYGNITHRKRKPGQRGKDKKKRKPKENITYAAIRQVFFDTLKREHRAPTIKELSQKSGFSVVTIRKYFEAGGKFENDFGVYKNSAKSLIPDMLGACYMRAMGKGQAANDALRLMLEIIDGYISPATQAQLDRMPVGQNVVNVLNQGGNIEIVSAVPDKDPYPVEEAEIIETKKVNNEK